MASNDQRLFFALWPGKRERSGLAGLQEAVSLRRARPTHSSDLHVTLVFLGATADDRLHCVTDAAASVSGTGFELVLDRVGYWPRPRILWCGVSVQPPSLLQLVGDLAAALEPCGFVRERRPYAPHVTLARNAPAQNGFEIDRPIVWAIRKFVLVSSTPGGPPPHYTVIGRWPLA